VEQAASLVSATIGAITRLIRDEDLMPGDQLPSEAVLAKRFQISRTTVREAFRSLATMRIIELATGKRATISPIDHGAMSLIIEHGVHTDQINIQQIYDVRRCIESRIVALAALRRSEQEADEIRREASAMRASMADPEQLLRHDLAFHMALAHAAKNPVFTLIVGAFQGITAQTWPIGWRSRTSAAARDAMIATHERIGAAITAGDPEEAVREMALHFDDSIRALISAGLS
jgi:GntR family transcriptional repressor for pyruvate dehydrogenase complex